MGTQTIGGSTEAWDSYFVALPSRGFNQEERVRARAPCAVCGRRVPMPERMASRSRRTLTHRESILACQPRATGILSRQATNRYERYVRNGWIYAPVEGNES